MNYFCHFDVVDPVHKKFSKSLKVSPENPFDWKFLKVGSVIVYSIMKNVPNLKEFSPHPAPPRVLTIKSVYFLCSSIAAIWAFHKKSGPSLRVSH